MPALARIRLSSMTLNFFPSMYSPKLIIDDLFFIFNIFPNLMLCITNQNLNKKERIFVVNIFVEIIVL